MKYYFIRANGESCHNNPEKPNCYVSSEPKEARFDYVEYCLDNNIARIGWPAVGDLSKKDCKNAMPDCYSFSNGLKKNIQQYLNDFKNINKGDIIVMPVKGRNFFYIGQVNVCYHYEHNAGARKYYECAHRIGVCWDKDYEGKFIPHGLDRLNMTNQGGWWIKAFSKIINKCTIKKINNLRKN